MTWSDDHAPGKSSGQVQEAGSIEDEFMAGVICSGAGEDEYAGGRKIANGHDQMERLKRPAGVSALSCMSRE